MIGEMNQAHGLGLGDLLGLPWPVWLGNLAFLWEAMVFYLPGLLLPLALATPLLLVIDRTRCGAALAVLGWAAIGVAPIVLLGTLIYSRYFLPGLPFLCLLLARAAEVLGAYLTPRPPLRNGAGGTGRGQDGARSASSATHLLPASPSPQRSGGRGVRSLLAALPVALAVLSAVPWAATDIVRPLEAAYTPNDYCQYVACMSSGYGIEAVIDAIERDAGGKPAIILHQFNRFGLPYEYLFLRLGAHPTLRVYVEDVQTGSREWLMRWSAHPVPIYAVLNRDEDHPWVMDMVEARWYDARIIAKVEKPGGRSAFAAYRLPIGSG
jgi:hypothetical protein